jgi:hypothetical protein
MGGGARIGSDLEKQGQARGQQARGQVLQSRISLLPFGRVCVI